MSLVFVIGAGFGGKYAWTTYNNNQNEKRLSREREAKRFATQQAETQKLERIKNPTAKVGDIVKMRDWEITVKKAVFLDKVVLANKGDLWYNFQDKNHYYDNDRSSEPKGTYLVVTINAKNVSMGDDNIYFGDELFKMVNENDAVYQNADIKKPFWSVDESTFRDHIFNYRSRMDLAPGFSVTGNIYYDVPTKDSKYRLILDDNASIALN